jgi:branched-chain amino acid transport system permease protein
VINSNSFFRDDRKSLFIATAVAIILVGVAPYFLDTYLVNVLIRAFLYAAVALTVDVLWGYTGILTFGQSAFFGIGAYSAGLIFTHMGFSTANAILAIAVGVGVAVAVAGIVGSLAFYHGASNLYGSVVTLVLPIIVTQIIFSGGNFTGSSSGLSAFQSFDFSMELWFWISGLFLILLTFSTWIFVRSDAGTVLVAIRENESRCEYLGINVSYVKICLLMSSAVIAAIAGYAFASAQMVVAPEYAGFVFGTELLTWVALGGRGTLIGPVIGTLGIDVSTSYLSGNLPFVWKLILGIIFVLVIVAMPRGMAPLFMRRSRRAQGDLIDKKNPVRIDRVASAVFEDSKVNAIELRGVRKHFGSLKVLEDITLNVRPGELVSLVGPNGAGKTTLIRCISDGNERSSGSVLINGHDIGNRPPYECVAFGIGRKFQMANTFEALTVVESLRIARTRLHRPSFADRAEFLELPDAAAKVIVATGLDKELDTETRHLSHGQKQALELAMVLALEPSVLLLDEPTAGLTSLERNVIGQILTELATVHRLCVVLVEHDLDFVRQISSRVIVLHQGKIVLDGTVEQVVESELVRTIYSGGAQTIGGHP